MGRDLNHLPQQIAARRAVLQLAYQKTCKDRAALITGRDHLLADAQAAAESMEFGRASALSLSAQELNLKIVALTEQIDVIQAELDEPEADVLIPFRPRVTLAEQHAAVDDMAGLVAA